MVARRIDEDDLNSVEVVDIRGQRQRVNAVNKFGAFDSILMSRTEQAKRVKRWLTQFIPGEQKAIALP